MRCPGRPRLHLWLLPPSLAAIFCRFFFFQAEDGIRDDLVTGVQTCALPIFSTDPHLGHGDLRLGQLGVTEVAALEPPCQHVADLLRHAQLALRWTGSLPPQAGTISVSKHSMTSPSCRSWKLANDRPHS